VSDESGYSSAVRRRLERILGTTLIGLGVDLVGATR
jgi:hypothetical protein